MAPGTSPGATSGLVQRATMRRVDDVPALLLALERLVRADSRGPGFAGAIAIGVQLRMRTCWWIAHCAGDEIATSFADAAPLVDAWILLDEDAADRAVRGAPLEVARAGGDLSVVERLAGRYAPPVSWLESRARGNT
jgi:hypothetical protein